MTETALIVGGTGFIGQAICVKLLSLGVKVHVIARHANRLPIRSNLHIHSTSMDDINVLAECLPTCDYVFFAASDTIPGNSAKKPMRELDNNLKPALTFLDAVQKYPNCHLIFFSSGGTVYGNPNTPEVTEDHALKPLSYHGAMKASLEAFMYAMSIQCGSHISVLRPSNVYGPKQRYRTDFGIIRKLLEHSKKNIPIEIWGDGETVRDYLFIDDCVTAALSVTNQNTTGFNCFNVGSGTGFSINHICNTVDRITGNKLQRKYYSARSLDVKKIVLNSTKLQCATGWQPTITLDSGIEKTWQWLQKNPNS